MSEYQREWQHRQVTVKVKAVSFEQFLKLNVVAISTWTQDGVFEIDLYENSDHKGVLSRACSIKPTTPEEKTELMAAFADVGYLEDVGPAHVTKLVRFEHLAL